MANTVQLMGHQLREIWKHFGINEKISVFVGVFVTVVILSGLVYWSLKPSYQLLYAGMTLEDAAAAQETLQDEQIKVQLKDSGRSVYVPAKDVYRGRLLLAGEGLPKETSAGFELFEEPKFGLTDFAQKINYQRALQGELARTISLMEGISSARVMLVLPEDKLFSREDKEASSASVMLNLARGRQLSSGQIGSIRQLVSSAVLELNDSGVTITDQYGNTLAKTSGKDSDDIEMAGEQFEAQQRFEQFLTQKAQQMLDKALGPNRSIVRVTAALDFSTMEKTREIFDSENRVATSETIKSESTSKPVMAGSLDNANASVRVSDPGNLSVEQSSSTTESEEIDTRYAVPAGTERIVKNGASVEGISVSVCVAQNDEPRTSEELTNIEEMVKTAVGFVDDAGSRKDRIKVFETSFPEVETAPAYPWWQNLPVSVSSLLNGFLALLVLVAIFIISRKAISALSVEREDIGVSVANLQDVQGNQAGALQPGGAAEMSFDDVASLAEQNPKAVAAWITNVTK